MRDEILGALEQIERDESCRVLFAVESGSRAWGFESTNSDWDVRFVYVRNRDAYLSLNEPRDVIEQNLPNDLDVVGWDLKKALKLIHKCNPSIMEWLNSPETYREDSVLMEELRALAKQYVQVVPAQHHYWSMASTNLEANFKKDRVSLKKYLYVIRPVLACRSLQQTEGWPSIVFDELVSEFLVEPDVRREVEALVAAKKQAEETEMGPKNPVIHRWLEQEIPKHKPAKGLVTEVLDWEPLDKWFRKVVLS